MRSIQIIKSASLIMLLLLTVQIALAQNKIIDGIAAVIGDEIVLRSDIEGQYQQFLAQGNYPKEEVKCQLIENLLLNRLLLNQSRVDSVNVADDRVESELDNRIRYFAGQIGSIEEMEAFYGKSVSEIKEEFRSLIKEQMLTESMRQNITSNISCTPEDVKDYYYSIPEDSLPLINSEVEYAQIVRNVQVVEERKSLTKDKLKEFRERILAGDQFSTLAILYSQDPGSAKNGGELGFISRADLVPEFSAVAFNLQPGQVSEIVETKFGFHIIQLIERRGDKINCRHILLKPTASATDEQRALMYLDSISNLIAVDSLTFSMAAQKFSDDEATKFSAGNVVNPLSGSTRFETDQVDATVFFQLDKLEPGEISNVLAVPTRDQLPAYKLFMLVSRSDPHKINLQDDYQRVQQAALVDKQNKALLNWVQKKKTDTYIYISDEYKSCKILGSWTN